MKKFVLGFVLGGILSPVLLGVAAIVYLRVFYSAEPQELSAPILPTVDADYDWSLFTPAGDEVAFADFKGKVVFLTFFKPTCDVCREELPYLQQLYEKTREDDIAFAMVATSGADQLVDLIAEEGLTMPVYSQKGYPDIFNSPTVPATYVLSPEGKVALRYRGPAKWDDESCIAYLRGLKVAEPEAPDDSITSGE